MLQYSVYNVDIFDRDFRSYYHDNVNSIEYFFDYLSPIDNKVEVLSDERVQVGDYIRLYNDTYSYFGIISSVDFGLSEGDLMEITYKPFTSIFDTTCVFDTNLQGGNTSLEVVLKNIIESDFVNNSDTSANISAIGTISVTSNTTRWGFNIKSDTEGQHHAIINLYNVLMTRGFNKYGVVVTCTPDYETRKVNISIGKISENPKTIEADLSNVIDRSIVIRGTGENVNKLTVINSAGYSQRIIYYLHPDGTYSTSNTDRIIPVINQYSAVDVPEDKTFAQVAASEAAEAFGNIEYQNLIELSVMNDDSMINPNDLDIGQEVAVIHDGISYLSILSGKEVGQLTKLIFGSIRLDLTKILKIGGM